MATSTSNNEQVKKRKFSLKLAVRMIMESDSEDVIENDGYDSNELESDMSDSSYILQDYQRPHSQPRKRTVAFHMFLDRLCHELIGGYRRFSIGRRISSPNDARLINAGDSVQHLVEHPVHATRNQRCVVCTEKYIKAKKQHPHAKDIDLPKRSKTVFWCSSCEVFLCVSAGSNRPNCFKLCHTLVEFWR